LLRLSCTFPNARKRHQVYRLDAGPAEDKSRLAKRAPRHSGNSSASCAARATAWHTRKQHHQVCPDILVPKLESKVSGATQDKIGTAIENLPDNEALNAVKLSINVKNINYFTVRKIRDVLTSEKDTAQKNWFGQYKSQATKDWQAILALYHKDNVHLAEAAQIMVQNVQYEVPALRKIVQNCVKQQQELHRKEGEYKRSGEEFKARYAKECAKLGIEGKQVRQELLQRSECLPALYLEMAQALRGDEIRKACALYEAFVEYATEKKFGPASGRGALLPALAALQKDELPTLQQMEAVAFAEDAVTLEDMQSLVAGGGGGDAGEIDWGDLGGGAEASGGGEIDWGDVGADAGDGDGIDWGDAGGDAAAGGDGIDWGDDGGGEIEIEVQEDGVDGEAAASEPGEAFKTATSRARLVSEVMELHTFLRARLAELDSDEYVAVGAQDLPAPLQDESSAAVRVLETAAASALALLTAPATQQLITLRSSRRFRDRLVKSLEQRAENAEKMVACIATCIRKRDELQEAIADVQPKIKVLADATRTVQRGTEELMTEQYKGRRINIVGDINTVLNV
jgi:hypothetical protein